MMQLIFLGGLDGIGKNMLALKYDDEIIIIDCGIMFPSPDLHGVDKIIPDMGYLKRHRDQVKAILLTHGHEDHIGAVPFLLSEFDIPVYGTPLTLGLVEHKLREANLNQVSLNTISQESVLEFKYFKFSFVRVSHSIPDGVLSIIETPVGRIVHSGDFKIDYTPIDGHVMDLNRLAKVGQEGVLLLLSDSTNAKKPGHTLSEAKVGESFERVLQGISGRIIVATFSSNIHRLQQAIDVAKKFGRKISFAGRSMENTAAIAKRLGYLDYNDEDRVFIGEVDKMSDNEVLVMATGSQGEPLSALTRMTHDEYHFFQIKPGDTVLMSALPIPGNEKTISSVIDKLGRKGIHVIYEEASQLHVSGHAYSEELKILMMLLKPQFFIPVHGEYRHLKAHTEIANDLGFMDEILIPENGDVIQITENSMEIVDQIVLHNHYVEGNNNCFKDSSIIDDRQQMAENGVVSFSLFIKDKEASRDLKIITCGFSCEDDDFKYGLQDSIVDKTNHLLQLNQIPDEELSAELVDLVQRYLLKKIGVKPVVLPILHRH